MRHFGGGLRTFLEGIVKDKISRMLGGDTKVFWAPLLWRLKVKCS